MEQELSFDQDFYFGYVADNLLKNLGPKALHYADQALVKMKTIGDDEGFHLWLSIHEHLTVKVVKSAEQAADTIH